MTYNELLETKPCPFCGGDAAFAQDSCLTYTVRCQDCAAQLSSCDIPSYTTDRNWLGKMKAEMISLWNRRATNV
jgi:Lar family restriction alleviation protein